MPHNNQPDLTACDREPIHIPGSIQAFGVLLAVDLPHFNIFQVSENSHELLGLTASEMLGRSVSGVIGNDAFQILKSAVESKTLHFISPASIRLPGSDRDFLVFYYHQEDILTVELEPLNKGDLLPLDCPGELPYEAIHLCHDTVELCRLAAKEIAIRTGFDRVMVYQFDEDWHGEVIVEENKAPREGTYLGHHFPASDIPAQARALFALNRIRFITDVNQPAVRLMPPGSSPINLSFTILRSVSPVHIEYLKNMGVAASLTISLMRGDRLWGMITCHHYRPLKVPYFTRRQCKTLGELVSYQVAAIEERNELQKALARKGALSQVGQALTEQSDILIGLVEKEQQILQTLNCTGAVIKLNGRLASFGKIVSGDDLERIHYLATSESKAGVFSTRHLAGLDKHFEKIASVASGVLYISLAENGSYILAFRKEIIESRTWAGNPNKPASVDPNARLHPRKSFDQWLEVISGHSQRWIPLDIDCALELKRLLLERNEQIERQRAIQALQESEEQYRLTFEQAAEGITHISMTGKWIRVNQAFCHIVGYERKELLHRSINAITCPDDIEGDADSFRALLTGEAQTVLRQKRYIRKDGSLVWVDVTAALVRKPSGAPDYIISIVEDISERKRLAEAIERQAALLDLTDDAIFVRDIPDTITFWNQGAKSLYGYTASETIGRTAAEILQTVFPQPFEQIMETLLHSGQWEGELGHTRKGGSKITVLSRWALERDPAGKPVRILESNTDITERKRAEAQTYFLANHDVLTGLPNRAYFNERINETIAQARRDFQQFALLLLDLDRFKSVNDTLGHDVGDFLLKEVAQRLLTSVGEIDVVARLGGDEFVILQKHLKAPQDAAILAGKIVHALSLPFNLNGQVINSGTSIGITVFPIDATDPVQLMKNADLALYRAKDQGRLNFQYFTEEMRMALTHRQSLEEALRFAIENNELQLHYQPQIDLHSGNLSGVEALLRWQNDQLRKIKPSELIDLAEETGLIILLGEWVLQTACKQYKAWQDAGAPAFRLGINFSARQLKDPRFISNVQRTLIDTDVYANTLEIEINERLLIENSNIRQDLFEELHTLGVSVAANAFGVGLSTLSRLNHFSINTLKIGKEYIQQATTNDDAFIIVSAIIQLSKKLGIRVVAEGVETIEQLTFLKNQECPVAQGFLFSPPVPAKELEAMIKQGKWLNIKQGMTQ